MSIIGDLIDWVHGHIYTRRCKVCKDMTPHSHHLTWLGRLRYGGKF